MKNKKTEIKNKEAGDSDKVTFEVQLKGINGKVFHTYQYTTTQAGLEHLKHSLDHTRESISKFRDTVGCYKQIQKQSCINQIDPILLLSYICRNVIRVNDSATDIASNIQDIINNIEEIKFRELEDLIGPN